MTKVNNSSGYLLHYHFSEFYEPGAMLMEDEGVVIAGLLVGLNVIDCNLGIKDEDLDQPVKYSFFIIWLFKKGSFQLLVNVCAQVLINCLEDYGRFPISSNTRIIRTPLTVLKSSPENCSFSPNSHVFLSNSFLNSSNTWSTIHKLYMYSSLMNITYLEFPCAIRWKKMIHMNCYTKKNNKNLI